MKMMVDCDFFFFLQEKYELFKERVTRAREDGKFADTGVHTARDHPSCIEVSNLFQMCA